MKHCKTYENAIYELQISYSNADKRPIIFTKWQWIRFPEDLANSSDDSEVNVFWKFVIKLFSHQNQLDQSYQVSNCFAGRLIAAIDVYYMQKWIWRFISSMAQHLASCIVNHLFEKSKTTFLAYMKYKLELIQSPTIHAFYTFVQKYCRAVLCSTMPFGKKGPKAAHIRKQTREKKDEYKMLSTSWRAVA